MRSSTVVAAVFLVFSQVGEAFSQSPVLTKNLAESGEGRAVGANSPWVGAQIAYRFGKGGDAADNLLLSGRILKDITLDEANRIHIPVMGNISSLADALAGEDSREEAVSAQADKLLLSSEGINVGVYPYYNMFERSKVLLTGHGVIAWRMNALRAFGDTTAIEDAERIYLNQGRFAVGADALLGDRSEGTAAILLSAAIVRHVFVSPSDYQRAFGERETGQTSLELVGVLPIMDNTGVIFEGVISSLSQNAFRAGIVIAAQ